MAASSQPRRSRTSRSSRSPTSASRRAERPTLARAMKLSEVMAGAGVPAVADVEVGDLAYDAAAVGPGPLFFCVPGFKVDGHAFAQRAVERGPVVLVVERPLALGVPEVVV